MTHEPDEGWKESPDPPKPSIDESVQMLQELADVKDAEKWEGAFNEIQTQLDEALTVAVDLQADVTRLTAQQTDAENAIVDESVWGPVDGPPGRWTLADKIADALGTLQAERDALQERLRDMEGERAMTESNFEGYVEDARERDREARDLIGKLVKYTGDVVGTMKEVMEIVGDDDGPTADYGPAFCQLNRDGQRLLDKARAYLGEPTPPKGDDDGQAK